MLKWMKEKKHYRLLLLGGLGKTSFLYWNKLKEVVKTIHTIGFNVETLEHNNVDYTIWDIGGCDKIRALTKYYYENTDATILFINTYNVDSIQYSMEIINSLINVYELPKIPTVFFFTHRDVPGCLDYKKVLDLTMNDILKINDRPYIIQLGCSFSNNGEEGGHKEIFRWIENELSKNPKQKVVNKQVIVNNSENKLKWMNVEEKFKSIPISVSDNYNDDEFITLIENYQLQIWDHKTHLRLGFIVLKRDGRRKAVGVIMKMIDEFIKNSNRTNGKTFHLTMTYFWIHMLHFAIALNAELDFEGILKVCPWLLNGRLFGNFYSDDLLLRNEECRKEFHPPDIMKLPDIL
jgi:ADP-ribosylation factor protein 1